MAQTARQVARAVASMISGGALLPGDAIPSVRELARSSGCSPATAARAHALLRHAGAVGGGARARTRVTAAGPGRAASFLAGRDRLRLAGSDDPALDRLVRAASSAVVPTDGPRGSVHGLSQLARGQADVAAIHLHHQASGQDNDPFAAGALGGEAVRLVHLWRRTQGLVVPRGNPRGIRGVGDLDGLRLAWRNRGSGSRLLLERLLVEAGLGPAPSAGEAVDSHLAVAVAVAAGVADAGLAVAPAASAVDADWLPLVVESFELVVAADLLPDVLSLLDAPGAPGLRRAAAGLPGYDLGRHGEVRVPA